MRKGIILDWNGTLFRQPTAEGLNREIGMLLLDDIWSDVRRGRLWRAFGILRLHRAKKTVEQRLAEYKQGLRPLQDVYEPFNDRVIRGIPRRFVEDAAYNYASKTHQDVDRDIAKPIWNVKKGDGRFVGILSVAYDYSIQATLRLAGFDDLVDYVFANRLVVDENEIARYLTFDIHGRKAEVMEDEFFRRKGLRPETTLYLGDTLDDEPVAGLLPEGHFIVPFNTSAHFRERMASKYGAFVPESREDLQDYLRGK